MRTIGIDIRLLGKQRTGDEAVFRHLTRAVLALESDLNFSLFTDEQDPLVQGKLLNELNPQQRPGVELVPLSASNRFTWNTWVLPRALARRQIDLYHTQYIAPLWLPSRTALVTHIHDVSFAAHPEWIGWRDRSFLRLLIPRSLRRAQAILTPSQFTASEVQKYFAVEPERVHIIPNAPGPAWHDPPQASLREKLLEQLGVTGPYIVALGTMQPRKNIPLLVTAFGQMRDKLGQATLVLVGNPAGHHVDPKVAAWAKTPPAGVVFAGYLEERVLCALVSGATLFVLPSLYEGFGIPLLEAFAVGVAVLAADIPPLREVGGEGAAFFTPTSLDSLENMLYTLFIQSDQRARLIDIGRVCLAKYSWEKSAQTLLKLYSTLHT